MDVLGIFWALNMVGSLQFMEGKKALRFHQYSNLCLTMNTGITGLEQHEGE